MTKAALREEIKERLKRTPTEEFNLQGEMAAGNFQSSPLWAKYKTLFIFLSLSTEINTSSLIELALKEEKKLFAPKIEGEKIVFYDLAPGDECLNKGRYGIWEPTGGKAAKSTDFPALIITPGLAFDIEGNRLGRGKAYYDRFFASLDESGLEYFALGFCMDFQIFKKVPFGKNDKKMNGLLSVKELCAL